MDMLKYSKDVKRLLIFLFDSIRPKYQINSYIAHFHFSKNLFNSGVCFYLFLNANNCSHELYSVILELKF